MAALLRQGARRIGGAVLQRTQAAAKSLAVAEEGRRLVPRRMYSTEEGHGELMREIQRRKDELYDLIAKGERNCKTNSWWDAFLLTRLCKDVTPRPSDCDWRDLMSSTSVISKIKTAGFFSLAYLAVDYYNGSSDDEKVAPGMMMK